MEITVPVAIRDMTHDDLGSCGWSGDLVHLAAVAKELDLAARDQADYLVVCPPSGLPVAKGGITYQLAPGNGTIWQLAVHPALQGLGLGTLLVHALEERIVARGCQHAEIRVDVENPRARELYERLGYIAFGEVPDSWETERGLYRTTLTVMFKQLRP
jgi:ribosomal protein S18 acetylase RimI-like enzyme